MNKKYVFFRRSTNVNLENTMERNGMLQKMQITILTWITLKILRRESVQEYLVGMDMDIMEDLPRQYQQQQEDT